jgi:hypothetical protein
MTSSRSNFQQPLSSLLLLSLLASSLALPLFSFPRAAAAACTPTAGGTATVEVNASQISYTLSNYTVSSSANDQILVVTTSSEAAVAISATFDGQAMTLVDALEAAFNDTLAGAGLFYLPNPPVTTANVVVTYNTPPDLRAGVSATVLDCVDTTTPPLSDTAETADTGISGSVTVVTPNTLLIDALGNTEVSSVSATTESGQTALFAQDLNAGTEWGSSYKLETGTGSSAMGWSGLEDTSALVIAGFAPQLTSPLDAPTNLTTTSVTGSIDLSWSAPAGDDLETYGVWRATSPFTATTSATLIASFATSTGTTYADTSAVRGISYYYRVTASNSTATSSLSNQMHSGTNSGRVIRLGGNRTRVQ